MSNYTPELIPLDQLDDNPYQPRLAYEPGAIIELAAAIMAEGLFSPPIGRRTTGGRTQLAFGHRRRRAYDHLAAEDPARWGAMPVIIHDLDDQAMARQAWKENRDRRDLTAYEEARAIARYVAEFGWSQKRVSTELGLDTSTISNKLRLLRLPPAALAMLERGELSERQAIALLPLAELPAAAWSHEHDRERLVYMDGRWRTTLDDVIAGAARLPADSIREHVATVLSKITVSLSELPWSGQLWGNLPGVRCATCKDCELRIKSSNRCPDLACAALKRLADLKRQAAAAAEAAKLPPVAIGAYGSYDNLSEVAINPLRAEAKRRGCGNLGVAVAGGAYLPKKVEGHPACGIVCAHGERGRCACKAAAVVTKGPDSAAAQKRADKKEIKDRYKEPAEAAIAKALAVLPAGTALMLLRRISSSTAQKLSAATPAAQIYEAIAVAIVKEEIKYSYDYDVKLVDAKKALTTLLEVANIPRPWEKAEAAAQDAVAAALAARIRQRCDEAIELADLPIAEAYLANAREALTQIAAADALHATLAAEIAGAAILVADGQQRRADAQAAESDPAAVLRANAPIPDVPRDGIPVISFAEILTWMDELERRIADGTAAEVDLELLADHLELLADDETTTDVAYEEANRRLGLLADQLVQREMAA